jgi:catalase
MEASPTHMNGYGSHTYSFISAQDERFWVKFHFKTQQGIKCMTQEEGDIMAGKDPDYHTGQLFEAIERGDYPRWTFYVQVMPEVETETYRWNPFDLTKVWPHGDYPLYEVGVLELNLARGDRVSIRVSPFWWSRCSPSSVVTLRSCPGCPGASAFGNR